MIVFTKKEKALYKLLEQFTKCYSFRCKHLNFGKFIMPHLKIFFNSFKQKNLIFMEVA